MAELSILPNLDSVCRVVIMALENWGAPPLRKILGPPPIAVFDMYAKCERVDCARTVFEDDLSEKSLFGFSSVRFRFSNLWNPNPPQIIRFRSDRPCMHFDNWSLKLSGFNILV
ncbi:hypothetical protein LguiA_001318 [Lonicera macranthoides]